MRFMAGYVPEQYYPFSNGKLPMSLHKNSLPDRHVRDRSERLEA